MRLAGAVHAVTGNDAVRCIGHRSALRWSSQRTAFDAGAAWLAHGNCFPGRACLVPPVSAEYPLAPFISLKPVDSAFSAFGKALCELLDILGASIHLLPVSVVAVH